MKIEIPFSFRWGMRTALSVSAQSVWFSEGGLPSQLASSSSNAFSRVAENGVRKRPKQLESAHFGAKVVIHSGQIYSGLAGNHAQ